MAMFPTKRPIGLVIIATLALGCVTRPVERVVDMRVQPAHQSRSGVRVKIVQVADNRRFETSSRIPSDPWLNPEYDTPGLRLRTLAWMGVALAVVLPQDRTIEDVAHEAVARGLGEGGFRVLDEGAEGYAEAMPLKVSIGEFWGWGTPGFWAPLLHFAVRVKISGPIAPFDEHPEFRGTASRRAHNPGWAKPWLKIAGEALDALNADFKRKVGAMHEGVTAASENCPIWVQTREFPKLVPLVVVVSRGYLAETATE